MRQNHRTVNNVGYKKIHPMSDHNDRSFCHYCGKKSIDHVKITEDHVPPLNVKIPEEYKHLLKKTLIPACSECNSLAGDTPHMDYLERHLWLKGRYIRRYKRKILRPRSSKPYNSRSSTFDTHAFEECMVAIGFGIIDCNQIKSDLLHRITYSGIPLWMEVNRYCNGAPSLDDQETEEDTEIALDSKHEPQNSAFAQKIDEEFLLRFIQDEAAVGNDVSSVEKYAAWADKNPSRRESLELPKSNDFKLNEIWQKLEDAILTLKISKEPDWQPELEADFLAPLAEPTNKRKVDTRKFAKFILNELETGNDLRALANYVSWAKRHPIKRRELGLPLPITGTLTKIWDSIQSDMEAYSKNGGREGVNTDDEVLEYEGNYSTEELYKKYFPGVRPPHKKKAVTTPARKKQKPVDSDDIAEMRNMISRFRSLNKS